MTKFFFDIDPNASHAERLKKLQRQDVKDMSPLARSTDLAKLQPAALRIVEEAIMREARAAAPASGRLFEHIERERTGREISTYEGDPKAWLKPFMARSARIKINNNPEAREEVVKLKPGQRVQIIG